MKLKHEVLKDYTINVTAGGHDGLTYDLREPAKNGNDTMSLYKTKDLNLILGYAADLITLEEQKDRELTLTEFAEYRQTLFNKLNDTMKVKKEVKEVEVVQ